MAAGAEPDRIGISCEGRNWTYGELWQAAQRAATLFQSSGCDHVALLDTGSEAAAIALFGAAIVGLPYVPLNYRLADTGSACADRPHIAGITIVGDAANVARLAEGVGHVGMGRADFIQAVSSGSDDEREAIDDGSSGRSAIVHQRDDGRAESRDPAAFEPGFLTFSAQSNSRARAKRRPRWFLSRPIT